MAEYDSYILCTSPRSGSTLLCSLLASSGVAGKPESYFHKPSVTAWLRALNLTVPAPLSEQESLQKIVDAAITAGTNGTGVFGLRMQGHSFAFFISKMAVLHPQQRGDTQLLTAAFGRICFVHLTRLDKVEQAVSLVMAGQTGLWHRGADGRELERLSAPQAPVYNRDRIDAAFKEVSGYDLQWQAWFAEQKIDPLRITYESLSANPARELGRILACLGVDTAAAGVARPGVSKLADATSREWIARYRKASGDNPP